MIPPGRRLRRLGEPDPGADICALPGRLENEGKFGFDAGDAEVGVLHLSTVRQNHVVEEIPVFRLVDPRRCLPRLLGLWPITLTSL